jgi:phosphatidate cytidylyltransferase
VAFVILILGPLFIPDKRFAFTLYAILGAFTLVELSKLCAKTGTTANFLVSASIYAIAVGTAYYMFFQKTSPKWSILIFALVCLVAFVSELFQSNDRPMERISVSIIQALYVASSFLGIGYFFALRNDFSNLILTISVFVLIWINDSGAYLIGRKIGKTKLFERLSPNKTWEGTIGGLFCALVAGGLLSRLENMPNLLQMIGFTLACVVFGSLGDLFESRIKRAAGVKDSGKFLPGHGGFFDRFDAMMLAIPAAIIYFELFIPKS